MTFAAGGAALYAREARVVLAVGAGPATTARTTRARFRAVCPGNGAAAEHRLGCLFSRGGPRGGLGWALEGASGEADA